MLAKKTQINKRGDWRLLRANVKIVHGKDDVQESPLVDQVGEGCLKTPPIRKVTKKK